MVRRRARLRWERSCTKNRPGARTSEAEPKRNTERENRAGESRKGWASSWSNLSLFSCQQLPSSPELKSSKALVSSGGPLHTGERLEQRPEKGLRSHERAPQGPCHAELRGTKPAAEPAAEENATLHCGMFCHTDNYGSRLMETAKTKRNGRRPC